MNKKTMFAISALCAAMAFQASAVESNIVGYQQLATEANCYYMMIPTFLNVAESNKCTLADLTVTGYDAPVYSKGKWSKGCRAGDFSMKKLGTTGATEATYHFLDDGVNNGWFADGDGAVIPGGASSVEITSGKGFWIRSANGYSLQPAGAVNKNDIVFQTSANSYYPVGNATPVDVELGDLTVTGYEAPVYSKGKWSKGCRAGDFSMKKLGTTGATIATFHYLDDGVNLGWYGDADGVGGVTNEVIKAGQGFWLRSANGYNLVIPAPELAPEL